MIADIDGQLSLDPQVVGAKAAKLAIARKHGFPVLPGFVVIASASRGHMLLGAEALPTRGSGGARLTVTGESLAGTESLVATAGALAPALVARSSTLLEGEGHWAGAFTSYVDITPDQLPKAVVGCWASAFTVDALERQESAGVVPGSFEMAVLVQPALSPEWGGVAEIHEDGTIVVSGIEGAPGPLLQGWVAGREARHSIGGSWGGDLTDRVGVDHLDQLASNLRNAAEILAANRCEWALDDQIWILQLDSVKHVEPARPPHVDGDFDIWQRVVRTVMSAPGLMGSELVHPWSIACPPLPGIEPLQRVSAKDVDVARSFTARLTSQVWGSSEESSLAASRSLVERLQGTAAAEALETIQTLREPDLVMAQELMSILAGIRVELSERGVVSSEESAWYLSPSAAEAALSGDPLVRDDRHGLGRWEPTVAAVVLGQGDRQTGAPASGGFSAGVLFPATGGSPPPRSIVYHDHASPALSQVMWDAAGLVTHGGSPAAHLFESARSLGVPAVTGVHLHSDAQTIVAVDGFAGVVASLPLLP